MQTTRLAIVGLGNVGRRLLELIQVKRDVLRSRFDLELAIVAASDSSGAAVASGALDIALMQKLKREHHGIADYPGVGQPGVTPQQMIPTVNADILVELSLTDLKHGQPGLDTIRGALKRKLHVVTANKGPLVLAYRNSPRLPNRMACSCSTARR
jgi:homoserine dehydrogenase